MALSDSQDNCVITYGESEAQIDLAGTVKKGDCVGFSGGWKRALATAGSVVNMLCVAAEDGESGQRITAYFGNVILAGTRLSGGTAGASLYVAEGTSAGKYTETAPDTSTDMNTIIGEMLTATTAILYPHKNVQSIVA